MLGGIRDVGVTIEQSGSSSAWKAEVRDMSAGVWWAPTASIGSNPTRCVTGRLQRKQFLPVSCIIVPAHPAIRQDKAELVGARNHCSGCVLDSALPLYLGTVAQSA